MVNARRIALICAIAAICALAFTPMAFAIEPFDSMDAETKKGVGLLMGVGVIFLSAAGLKFSHNKWGAGSKKKKSKKSYSNSNKKKKKR